MPYAAAAMASAEGKRAENSLAPKTCTTGQSSR